MSIKTIASMVDWVEDHIEQQPTIEKLAEHVGYSEFYCSVKFHEHVGMSYKEYISNRKLALAASALEETSVKILDIALQFGFSSNEAFTRAFRKKFGYTPSRYRSERPQIPRLDKIEILAEKHS